MRDIIQEASDTDKRVRLTLLRSVWLSSLLPIGSVCAGALSIFSVAALVKTEPAQANITAQPASLLAQTVEEEPASYANSRSSEHNCSAQANPNLVNGKSLKTAEENVQIRADSKRSRHTAERLNVKDSGTAVALMANAEAHQGLCVNDDAEPDHTNAMNRVFTGQPSSVVLAPTPQPLARIPAFTPPSQTQTKLNLASPVLAQAQPKTVATVNMEAITQSAPTFMAIANSSSSASTPTTTDPEKLRAQVPADDKPMMAEGAIAPSSPTPQPAVSSVERNQPEQLAQADTNTAQPTSAPEATAAQPTPYSGPGGASLLGEDIQAQYSGKEEEPSSVLQNTRLDDDPLAPTLLLQGGFIYQDGASARARVTGIYPISPNALFGGTLDLTTGDDFSDSEGTGLDLNELYFTGSLPSLPNLRMTVGLIDLTSYFDRNSFAKDSLTHFFNPVFQTNPALAAAGIGSRPGILVNWDITDNVQARVAAFSSSRDLGDFALDGYAGELAFRFGNAIIRGTFASNRDAGRNNGFEEIYGIPRDNGDFGIRSSDRENAYGINAEYFIPEIKMGLFARYGHYENTSLGEGGDTYSLGFNFLDLFMPDDRLGFGYGRNLSNSELRSANGGKVPDVWELFYDFRILPNLRAGLTLQARDEFSDVLAGFRVRADVDVLGELFR